MSRNSTRTEPGRVIFIRRNKGTEVRSLFLVVLTPSSCKVFTVSLEFSRDVTQTECALFARRPSLGPEVPATYSPPGQDRECPGVPAPVPGPGDGVRTLERWYSSDELKLHHLKTSHTVRLTRGFYSLTGV